MGGGGGGEGGRGGGLGGGGEQPDAIWIVALNYEGTCYEGDVDLDYALQHGCPSGLCFIARMGIRIPTILPNHKR